MRSIALFLLSSILTPATLAAGQTTCLLTTNVKVMTPLPADNSTTGWTVISNSSGSCIAKPVEAPLRAITSRETISPILVTEKSNAVVVMEILLNKLGWTNGDESFVSVASAAVQVNHLRARRSDAVDGADPTQKSRSTRSDNAVVWF